MGPYSCLASVQLVVQSSQYTDIYNTNTIYVRVRKSEHVKCCRQSTNLIGLRVIKADTVGSSKVY